MVLLKGIHGFASEVKKLWGVLVRLEPAVDC